MRAIDLECGIGGMTLGFAQAGFDIRLSMDDEYHLATFKKNIITPTDSPTISPYTMPHPDVILGAVRKRTDKKLISEIISIIKPRVLCFELFEEGLDWEKLGYKTYSERMNAKDFGLPQDRIVSFDVSFRKDIKSNFHYFPFPDRIPLKPISEFIPGAEETWVCRHIGLNTYKLSKLYEVMGRKLTEEEINLLMGFPPKFTFDEKGLLRYKILGETTCPTVAKALALEIKDWIY